ncbi:universal stress protein [Mariniflexile ostreae]|uniref:Universal stress protein n=1 Tax=Mariniflexile ostreae TaxID=1520892 RepID=A0ABV5F9K9_9FLAO
MRKILIPTDFSENAMNAIRYAVDLFKYEICEFYFMNAYRDDIYAQTQDFTQDNIDRISANISKKSEELLGNIKSHFRNKLSNPKHTYFIKPSDNLLMDETNRIVDEENIDLIVMGTKGKANNKKITFGSNTLQVLKYVTCPVLAIPENYKYSSLKHILFPTDYMVPYKRRELKLLCELAYPFNAIIDMLYISKSNTMSLRQKDNKAFIEKEFCKNNINFKIENSNHITNSIFKAIKENKTDMLVMINTKHSFLENIVFQSTIDKLSLNLDIPFLALQNITRA